jgi:hypothetical protein
MTATIKTTIAISQEIGLPGKKWMILGALGGLFAERGEDVKARQAYQEAAIIIHHLAETIDEDGLREGFLTAVSVQSVLALSEMV